MANILAALGQAVPQIEAMQHTEAINKGLEQEAVMRNYQLQKMKEEEDRLNKPIPMDTLSQRFGSNPTILKHMTDMLRANGGIKNVNGVDVTNQRALKNYQQIVESDSALKTSFLKEGWQNALDQENQTQQEISEAQASGNVKKVQTLTPVLEQRKKAREAIQSELFAPQLAQAQAMGQIDQDKAFSHEVGIQKAKQLYPTNEGKPILLINPQGNPEVVKPQPGVPLTGYKTPGQAGKSEAGKPSYTDNEIKGMLRDKLHREPTHQEFLDAQAKQAGVKAATAVSATQKARTTTNLSADAIEQNSDKFNMTGTLPPFGMMGVGDRIAIINRAAEKAKQAKMSGGDITTQQTTYGAFKNALNKLEGQRAPIMAFERTAEKNFDIAEAASKKLDRLNVPALDRWLNAGRRSVKGDKDVTDLDVALRTAVNEYAKVTSSPTGAGVIPQTERDEWNKILSPATSKEQIESAIAIIRKDMANRKYGFDEERATLKQSISDLKPGGQGQTSPAEGNNPKKNAPGVEASKIPVNTVKTVGGKRYRKVKGGWQPL